MRPTNRFLAVVIFLLVLLCTSTPATAQFLPGNEPEGAYPQPGVYQNPVALSLIENGGTVALKVQLTYTRPCIGIYSAFVQLERDVAGKWVPEGSLVPVQLGRFGRGPLEKTLRTAAVFTSPNGEGFVSGDYRLKISPWLFGGDGCPVVQYITHIETPFLHIGAGFNSRLSRVEKASIPSLNDGRIEFQANLVSRSRLTIFQEFGSERVVGFSEDYLAGNTTIRTKLHPEFRPGLPIKVHVINLESGDSTVATLFEPAPNVRFNNFSRNEERSEPEWK